MLVVLRKELLQLLLPQSLVNEIASCITFR